VKRKQEFYGIGKDGKTIRKTNYKLYRSSEKALSGIGNRIFLT